MTFAKSSAATYTFHSLLVTAGGSYNKWNFLERIRKGVELAQVIKKKKATQFRGPLFWFVLGIFKECYTLLWNHTCNELRFFQNSQYKPRNFSGVFAKAFPQQPQPCLFFLFVCFFFLEQTTDRQIDLLLWVLRYRAHFTGLELHPEPSQNKICFKLHPKYTSFSCFPIICSFAI